MHFVTNSLVLAAASGLGLAACVVFDAGLLKADAAMDVATDAIDDPDATDDATLDAVSDVPADTPIDTAPDVPPPQPVCISFDHDCNPGPSFFYPGGANQSCNDVCAGHGGWAGVPTKGIGSDAPDSERCRKALQAIYQSTASVTSEPHSVGVGCARLTDGTFKHFNSPATTEGAKATNVQRVCACQQNDACQIFDDCP